jgi:hypothetical protein
MMREEGEDETILGSAVPVQGRRMGVAELCRRLAVSAAEVAR